MYAEFAYIPKSDHHGALMNRESHLWKMYVFLVTVSLYPFNTI